jgi:Zn-finger nucleic acid-binding protein
MWFDKDELDKVIHEDSRDFEWFDLQNDYYDGMELKESGTDLNSRKGKCPKCGTEMKQIPYKGNKDVTIDICVNGHGVWLDGGEIRKLRKRGIVDFVRSVKFAFSREGFQAFLSKIRGR